MTGVQTCALPILYIAHCHRALGRVGTAFVQYRLAVAEAQDRLAATRDRRFATTRDAAQKEVTALTNIAQRNFLLQLMAEP